MSSCLHNTSVWPTHRQTTLRATSVAIGRIYAMRVRCDLIIKIQRCYNNVSPLAANIRKLVYSLWRSLNASVNVLANTALRSDLLVRSPVFRRWRNILFKLWIFTVNVFSPIVFYCMGFEPAIECEWNEIIKLNLKLIPKYTNVCNCAIEVF